MYRTGIETNLINTLDPRVSGSDVNVDKCGKDLATDVN